jgi:hypothetical protein
MNIIFLDIDGPMIPARTYYKGDRPFDHQWCSFIYDPVAVGMINRLCEQFKAQVVFSTAHNENTIDIMQHQAKYNGLRNLHSDCQTPYPIICGDRYAAIKIWLADHLDETDEWIVIDDLNVYLEKQVVVDFEIGMTLDNFNQACFLFGEQGVDWTLTNLWNHNVLGRKSC